MDFFSSQETAKRYTRYLVALFVLAVFIIIMLVTFVTSVCLFFLSSDHIFATSLSLSDFFSWDLLIKVSLVVCPVISCAVLCKWMGLSEGGKAVAESLGGKRIPRTTDDPLQRRLLNVVEEMALAAGMPVPSVYLLGHERGINAFAAGKEPSDAVIAVTKGCLELLNRDELQGVIAHEFSHILNGDMRLNLRLMALLNGILFISSFGKFLLRSSHFGYGFALRRLSSFRLLFLGVILVVIGWIGAFWGYLIKSAINWQREYLADASAVQFTRNKIGIANALRKIGGYSAGSRVLSPGVDDASHMFIAGPLSDLVVFFSTHPPLEKRIKRVLPGWDGTMISYKKSIARPKPKKEKKLTDNEALFGAGLVLATIAGSGMDPDENEKFEQRKVKLSEVLKYTSDPFSATALIFALALDKNEVIQKDQMDHLQNMQNGYNLSKGVAQIGKKLVNIDPAWRIILIERAIPQLKWMSKKQYGKFKKALLHMIQADKKIDFFEWCLYQLTVSYLDPEFGEKKENKLRYRNVHDLEEPFSVVLSALVHYGHSDAETAEKAFTRGATTAGLYSITLMAREECTMKRFNRAVKGMALSPPLLKARLLKGMSQTVEFDKIITPLEKELITAVAAVMECPVPRLTEI